MLTIDYKLDSIGGAMANDVDLASADPASLRYRLFPGDVIIRTEDADFTAAWGWVQVLDFALSLKSVASTLAEGRTERMEFTESDAALDFFVEGDRVCISSNYAPGLLRISVTEFENKVDEFVRRVAQDLCDRHPRLAKNPEVARHFGR
jgi:hypothetical protein